ncbi:MAG TPA: hypothetical protein HPP76_09250 [Desulfuromonadales bacterium]|nr:hypothetical protein [Desulfuromonadales bacterium]
MGFKSMIVVMAAVGVFGLQAAGAAEISVKSGDSIQKLLEEQKGKRVTVRLQGNDEMTGKVRVVTKELLHLGELAGRDYFDAVIDLHKVSAVIVRVKE